MSKTDLSRRVYIAGPMSGIPQFNFPAFERAAATLREQGHDVVSPAETDSPGVRKVALESTDGDMLALARVTGETWGDLLAQDVKLIADGGIDEIRVLPGWQRSRGARLETFIGCRLCNIVIRDLDGEVLTMDELTEAWVNGR